MPHKPTPVAKLLQNGFLNVALTFWLTVHYTDRNRVARQITYRACQAHIFPPHHNLSTKRRTLTGQALILGKQLRPLIMEESDLPLKPIIRPLGL
jgi:hypothetical protein